MASTVEHRDVEPGLDDNLVNVTGERLVSGRLVVSLTGEIDVDTAPDVEAAVHHHLDHRVESLVVDLTGVTFMGSAGLNLLVALKIDCARRGIGLQLVATSRAVLHSMEVTDLISQFAIVDSVEAAEAAEAS